MSAAVSSQTYPTNGIVSVVRASSAPSQFSQPAPYEIVYLSTGKSFGGGDLAGGIIGGVALGALLATMFFFLFMRRQRGRQGAWVVKWLKLEPMSSVPPAYSESVDSKVISYPQEKVQKLEIETSVVVTQSAV